MTMGEELPGWRPPRIRKAGRQARRWPWALLALVVVACAGVVAVPASWAVRKQAEAERGEPAPEAAATVWLMKLSAGEEDGLSRVLAKSRHDELLDQFVRYRDDIAGSGRPVSKLEAVGSSVIEHQGDDRATVEEQVRGVWWGDGTNLAGTPHMWQWQLRKDRGGWRVWSVDLPPWCGVHIRAELCRR
ncbi:hypothetical protein V6U89_13200 [Micromonospora sp. CPCC 206171]|uniref:hypothetical protein n=1 Tax=Micromonospora sp. CPCC 206171 TaxID=3122405 RepID=UPI002FF435DC